MTNYWLVYGLVNDVTTISYYSRVKVWNITKCLFPFLSKINLNILVSHWFQGHKPWKAKNTSQNTIKCDDVIVTLHAIITNLYYTTICRAYNILIYWPKDRMFWMNNKNVTTGEGGGGGRRGDWLNQSPSGCKAEAR